MDKQVVVRLHSSFEEMAQLFPDTGTEFWCARDLQMLLGYAKWENFAKVIDKAITSCETASCDPRDHFLGIRKMVDLGSGAKREIEDIALTRYACYLIAQNGDPSKDQIAFAQSYFAVQTRKQEIIETRLAEAERVSARHKLTRSEKELSGIIFDRLQDNESFGRIRSKGDQALFGGRTTQDMKNKLGVPKGRALADFLPTITIKAKDFANEITNFNIKQRNLSTEMGVTDEHTNNNQDVRKLLLDRGIGPEALPRELRIEGWNHRFGSPLGLDNPGFIEEYVKNARAGEWNREYNSLSTNPPRISVGVPPRHLYAVLRSGRQASLLVKHSAGVISIRGLAGLSCHKVGTSIQLISSWTGAGRRFPSNLFGGRLVAIHAPRLLLLAIVPSQGMVMRRTRARDQQQRRR